MIQQRQRICTLNFLHLGLFIHSVVNCLLKVIFSSLNCSKKHVKSIFADSQNNKHCETHQNIHTGVHVNLVKILERNVEKYLTYSEIFIYYYYNYYYFVDVLGHFFDVFRCSGRTANPTTIHTLSDNDCTENFGNVNILLRKTMKTYWIK